MNQISAKRLKAFGGRMPRSSLDKPGQMRKPLGAKPNTIGPDDATVDAVLDRDCAACVVCGVYVLDLGKRGSAWSVHHRRRVRTDNRMSNLVIVCGGADFHGCHQEIHANVAKAELAGWLVRKASDPADKVMAHSQFGWPRLDDDGGIDLEPRKDSDGHPF